MKQNGFLKTDGIILAVISKEPKIDLCKYIFMIDAYYRIVVSYEELAEALENCKKTEYCYMTAENCCVQTKVKNF